MEMMVLVSIYLSFSIGTFIVYELLKQLGFWQWLVETIYTHPKFNKVMFILADIIYGVAVGVLGSVGFNYYQGGIVLVKALIYGIIMITVSSILKEYMKKEK